MQGRTGRQVHRPAANRIDDRSVHTDAVPVTCLPRPWDGRQAHRIIDAVRCAHHILRPCSPFYGVTPYADRFLERPNREVRQR